MNTRSMNPVCVIGGVRGSRSAASASGHGNRDGRQHDACSRSAHLTQSALSHQLRDIEARFKTPILRPAGTPHGAHAGWRARADERAPRARRSRADGGGRAVAGRRRGRRDPGLHAVQHGLPLAGAAAGDVQPAVPTRRRERARRRNRSSRARHSSKDASISRSSSAAAAIVGSGCARCSWMKWWRSSRRIIHWPGEHGYPPACSRRNTC